MRLFGLMVVRNEADIIRVNLLHHLAAGVEHILVIDNGSTDGTSEILDKFAREGTVSWRRDPGLFKQYEMTNELVRQALTMGADWILPIDADEFWASSTGSITSELELTDKGALKVEVETFIQSRAQLTRRTAGLLSMKMRVPQPVGPPEACQELVTSGRIAYVEMEYPPKWIAKPTGNTVVDIGNHAVTGVAGPLGTSSTLRCLHAPLRASSQLEEKAEQGLRCLQTGSPPGTAWHVKRWYALQQAGQLDQEWAANSYDGDGYLDVFGSRRALVEDDRLVSTVATWVNGLRNAEKSASLDQPVS